MNFLAHLFLSGSSEPIMVGNFITDFMKGSKRVYPGSVAQGIRLHRQIDTFTDTHPQVRLSRKRLWQHHRHYSAVITDLFYDHFLAKNWRRYSDTSLERFAHRAYAILQTHQQLMPQKAATILDHMRRDNWLVHYRELEGVEKALQGVARRARFQSRMATARRDLERDYQNFEEDFHLFFPALITHTKKLNGDLAADP